jgi:hypothetical protein
LTDRTKQGLADGPRTWAISPGPWEVAAGLTGELAVHNGLTVFARDGRAVANCANSDLPLGEQRANARAIGAVPEIVAALEGAEDYIGDMPRNPRADVVYRDIAHALGLLRHGGRG